MQLCYGSTKDSIFCSVNKPNTDRILLFEKHYFVWFYEDTLKDDTIPTLFQMFGKYHYKNDTLFFTMPDSTDKRNSLFCYCQNQYDTQKQFQFYKKHHNYPPGMPDKAYSRIFTKDMPALIMIGIGGSFKAVRTGNTLELIYEKQKYMLANPQ